MEILRGDAIRRERLSTNASHGQPTVNVLKAGEDILSCKLAGLIERVEVQKNKLGKHSYKGSREKDQLNQRTFSVKLSNELSKSSDIFERQGSSKNSLASSPGRNCCIPFIPLDSNNERLTPSYFVSESQTLRNSSESIIQTCHLGSEVENSQQSGSLVNSPHSKISNETDFRNLLEQKFLSQAEQKIGSSNIFLNETENKKEHIFVSSVYLKDVCLPKLQSEVSQNNILTTLNKDSQTKTAKPESYSVAEPSKSFIITKNYRNSDGRLGFHNTVQVGAHIEQNERTFNRTTTLTKSNTHETLKSFPKQTFEEIQHFVITKPSERGKNFFASQSKSQFANIGKVGTTKSADERFETSKKESKKLQLGTQEINDPDTSFQTLSAIHAKSSKNTAENLRVVSKLHPVPEDHKKAKLVSHSSFVSEVHQYCRPITYSANLYSSSSDQLTTNDVNGDTVDSDCSSTGIELDEDTDSLSDESDDGKEYSVYITRGGEIAFIGSDRFTSSEMSYDSVISDLIDMQIDLSDEQKAGDKNSIAKNSPILSISNNCRKHRQVGNSCRKGSRNLAVNTSKDWTCSESENASPRQLANHRETRKKTTSRYLQTLEKDLVFNSNKTKICNKIQKREKNPSKRVITGTIKPMFAKEFDFSAEEQQSRESEAIHKPIQHLILSGTKKSLPVEDHSVRETSSLFNESSSITDGEDSCGVFHSVTTNVSKATQGQGVFPGCNKFPNKKCGNKRYPSDSRCSMISDSASDPILNVKVSHKSCNQVSSKNEGYSSLFNQQDSNKRNSPSTHNTLCVQEQPHEQTIGDLRSHDLNYQVLSTIARKYTSSPVSSVDTSDFSLSDDVLTDCSCSNDCQCQTGISTKDDFKEELKSASHYLLAKRQRILYNSKSSRSSNVSQYHLDVEEGEMNILELMPNGNNCNPTKEIPLVVKVILRLRKHFYGKFEHQQLSTKDVNNNLRSKKDDEASPGQKRISFSPSVMLMSAVSESSISEIREVMENEQVNVNQLSPSGKTLLHKAAAAGDIESIHTLVSYGADVNLTDQNGVPPFHSALRHAHYKCAVFLIEQGTDLNQYTRTRIREFREIKHMSQRNFDHVLNTYV